MNILKDIRFLVVIGIIFILCNFYLIEVLSQDKDVIKSLKHTITKLERNNKRLEENLSELKKKQDIQNKNDQSNNSPINPNNELNNPVNPNNAFNNPINPNNEPNNPINPNNAFNNPVNQNNELHNPINPNNNPAQEISKDKTKIGISKEKIVIHLIPHSHLDAGWLKTMEQYYTEEVRSIINTLLDALEKNKERRFAWVEVGYLERWWSEVDQNERNRFKNLVKNGQIELIMGGWVSHDEATTNYHEVINQMTIGHKFLLDNIGPNSIPKYGWQIDPFGISTGVNTIFSQMCFEGNTIWRIGKNKYQKRAENKKLEFIWQSSEDLGDSSDMFVHLLQEFWGYTQPDSSIFRNGQINPRLAATSLKETISANRNTFVSKKNFMMLFGHDFYYIQAEKIYDLLEQTLDILKKEENDFEIIYSNVTTYMREIKKEGIAFPKHQPFEDFFPYQAGPVNWWTGYFTSIPVYKRACREHDNLLRSSEILFAWAFTSAKSRIDDEKEIYNQLEYSRRQNGIKTHHDAITGTAREHVRSDYFSLLSKATESSKKVIEASLNSLNKKKLENLDIKDSSKCHHSITEKNSVVIFNSLGWRHPVFLCFLVKSKKLKATKDGKIIEMQSIEPNISWENGSPIEKNDYKLIVKLEVDPLQFDQISFLMTTEEDDKFYVGYSKNLDRLNYKKKELPKPELENQNLKITFNEKTGEPVSIFHKTGPNKNKSFLFQHLFHKYLGNKNYDNHYAFYTTEDGYQIESPNQFFVSICDCVQRLRLKINDDIIVSYSLFDGSDSLNIETIVGRVASGENIVVKYLFPEIKSDNKFWSDDNGLQFVRRDFDKQLPYYTRFVPMVYGSIINDNENQVSLISDTPESITSNDDGGLDLILHRNSVQMQGNGELMKDTSIATINHLLFFDKTSPSKINSLLHRKRCLLHNFPPLIIKKNEDSVFNQPKNLIFQNLQLDPHVHLLSLQIYDQEKSLVSFRLLNHIQNSIESHLNKQYFSPSEVSLDKLFPSSSDTESFESIEETTLSFNQNFEKCKRDILKSDDPSPKYPTRKAINGKLKDFSNQHISLSSLDIRSFVVKMNQK